MQVALNIDHRSHVLCQPCKRDQRQLLWRSFRLYAGSVMPIVFSHFPPSVAQLFCLLAEYAWHYLCGLPHDGQDQEDEDIRSSQIFAPTRLSGNSVADYYAGECVPVKIGRLDGTRTVSLYDRGDLARRTSYVRNCEQKQEVTI